MLFRVLFAPTSWQVGTVAASLLLTPLAPKEGKGALHPGAYAGAARVVVWLMWGRLEAPLTVVTVPSHSCFLVHSDAFAGLVYGIPPWLLLLPDLTSGSTRELLQDSLLSAGAMPPEGPRARDATRSGAARSAVPQRCFREGDVCRHCRAKPRISGPSAAYDLF